MIPMDNGKVLIYDGSFNGFLTVVYQAFDKKTDVTDIQKNRIAQRGLFSATETVFTKMGKARKVWNGIQSKSNSAIENIYFAFLSETNGVELLLYRYIKKLFSPTDTLHLNFTTGSMVRIGQLAKAVRKEKHHIETFIRFQLTQDQLRFATISPEFDVLPLITKHFRSRHANQQWLIYDIKRKYGVHHNLKKTEIISLNLNGMYNNVIQEGKTFSGQCHNSENQYNDYFKKIDVRSRINAKLRTPQHDTGLQLNYLDQKRAG